MFALVFGVTILFIRTHSYWKFLLEFDLTDHVTCVTHRVPTQLQDIRPSQQKQQVFFTKAEAVS